ncbi:hypothetical protein Tco_0286491 [Tanacetum coccineum]
MSIWNVRYRPHRLLASAMHRALPNGVFGNSFEIASLRVAQDAPKVDPPRDITVPTTPPKRFLTQDFIGPQFTEMPMTWSPDVTLVSVKEKFRNVMKCLKIPSKFAKSLTCGASISWGRSRIRE